MRRGNDVAKVLLFFPYFLLYFFCSDKNQQKNNGTKCSDNPDQRNKAISGKGIVEVQHGGIVGDQQYSQYDEDNDKRSVHTWNCLVQIAVY